jgi:tetratricopeptide (TPR) repeat protein
MMLAALLLLLAQPANQPDSKSIAALTSKAKQAMAAGDMDSAERSLETAIAAAPKQSYPRFLLGFLFYLKNDFDRARDTLAQADENDPRVALYVAMTEEALNHPEAAVANYERALKLDKTTPEPRVSYARMLRVQGNLTRAEALIEEALKLAPRSPDAQFEKGQCLFDRGEFAKAAEYGEQALAAALGGPLERRIRYLLVRAYGKTGSTQQAEKHRVILEKLPMPMVR